MKRASKAHVREALRRTPSMQRKTVIAVPGDMVNCRHAVVAECGDRLGQDRDRSHNLAGLGGRAYPSAARLAMFANTGTLVGERWSLLILRDAMVASFTRYSPFEKSPGLATNVLAKRLDDFVAAGLMEHRQPAASGEKAEYVLTQKGLESKPVIIALTEWGDTWVRPGPSTRSSTTASRSRCSYGASMTTRRSPSPKSSPGRVAPSRLGAATNAWIPLVFRGHVRGGAAADGLDVRRLWLYPAPAEVVTRHTSRVRSIGRRR